MRYSKSISSSLIVLALAFLPVSLAICQIFLVLFGLVWLLRGNHRKNWEAARLQPLLWGYVALFTVHLTGVIYSEDTANAWFNLEKKVPLFVLPVILAMTGSIDPVRLRQGLQAYIGGCILATFISLGVTAIRYAEHVPALNFDPSSEALYGVLQQEHASAWDSFSYISLASGIGMHPTYLALYLVFAIVLIFFLYAERFAACTRLKQAGLIGVVLYLEIFIVLLSSRIMLAGLALTLVGGWVLSRSFVNVRISGWLMGLLLIPCSVIWLNPVSAYRFWQEPLTLSTYQSNEQGTFSFSTGIRKSLWELGIHTASRTNPLIGSGTGDVKLDMKAAGEDLKQQNIIQSYDPHNQFIYTQVGLGLTGLLILIFCLLYPAVTSWNEHNYLYLALLLLFSMLCLTESALEVQWGITFFSLFNGLLFSQRFSARGSQLITTAHG